MPFKTGKVVYEDGGFSVARQLALRPDGNYEFAGFSLIGNDIDPSVSYGSVEAARQTIDRLLGRSPATVGDPFATRK